MPITSDVIEFIARKVVSQHPRARGRAQPDRRVRVAWAPCPITIELAQAVLSNVLYNPKKRQVTPERIAQAVSDYYGVPMDALQGQKRDKAIVMPRQIAMFLMREETDVSLLRIGAELGGRDHSTVLHACDKITREIAGQRRAAARDRGRPRADLRRLSRGLATQRRCHGRLRAARSLWITARNPVEKPCPVVDNVPSRCDRSRPQPGGDRWRTGRPRTSSTAGTRTASPAERRRSSTVAWPVVHRRRPHGSSVAVHRVHTHDDGDDGVRR